MLTRSPRVALIGGALVFIHAATDYIGGFPHHVFGPESHPVGTGMYYTSPYLAVALEALFTVAVMLWVLRFDARAGIRRSRGALIAWAAVFVGGVLFMFSSADLSLVELTGIDPLPAMDGSTIPGMFLIYGGMTAALLWADRQPTSDSQQV